MHACSPLRAACAATALARLPVDEHDTASNPNALRIRQRHRHHAILKAERGQAHGVVLEVEIASRQASSPAAAPTPTESSR